MIDFKHIEPAVFTAEEAAKYLRLDEGRDMEKALRSLRRLVDDKKAIVPLTYAESRMYAKAELDRFVRDQVEGRR